MSLTVQMEREELRGGSTRIKAFIVQLDAAGNPQYGTNLLNGFRLSDPESAESLVTDLLSQMGYKDPRFIWASREAMR